MGLVGLSLSWRGWVLAARLVVGHRCSRVFGTRLEWLPLGWQVPTRNSASSRLGLVVLVVMPVARTVLLGRVARASRWLELFVHRPLLRDATRCVQQKRVPLLLPPAAKRLPTRDIVVVA